MIPKILILQEAGRHIKNAKFREALSYQRAFTKIGVESEVWGLGYENFTTPFNEIVKSFSVILLLENYNESGWVPDLSPYKDKIKCQIAIDAHCNLDHLLGLCNKNSINIHFGATHRYLNNFKAPGRECHWLANAYDDTLIYPMDDVEKKYDLGFCGNIVNRGDWISALERDCHLKKDIFVIGNDMVKAVNSYKMVWNRNMSDDINYRNFEALGCRKLLFTNYSPTMELLFDIERHLVIYHSLDDLKEKLNFFLKNGDIRRKIANEGYLHVKANHTFVNRARSIMDILNNYKG